MHISFKYSFPARGPRNCLAVRLRYAAVHIYLIPICSPMVSIICMIWNSYGWGWLLMMRMILSYFSKALLICAISFCQTTSVIKPRPWSEKVTSNNILWTGKYIYNIFCPEYWLPLDPNRLGDELNNIVISTDAMARPSVDTSSASIITN